MESNKPLIVVMSRNYSIGLSVIRSLGAEGYTVDLIASAYKEGQSNAIASSRYINRAVEVLARKVKADGDDDLLNELLKYKGRYSNKPVLFPTDDYTTSVMDLNRGVLDDIFIMPKVAGGAAGDLKHLMDKSVQSRIAAEAGINVPAEWVISLRDKEIQIPEDVVYPCYCKPLESSLGYKQEMAVCRNRSELLSHLSVLRGKYSDRSFLVQEYLEIDEEIDLEGVCLDQEIILPAIIWKRIVAQYDKGVPLAGKTYPAEELGEILDKVINMLKTFHYYGMFDLGLNIVNGRIYFNEINMRSGGTNFVYFRSGVNLPDIFVKGITGQSRNLSEEKITEYGKTYIYEKVAWDDYFHGYLSKAELDECMRSADIKIMCNDDDPAPGESFTKEMEERDRRRQQREEHIISVMKSSGWDREYTEQHMRESREKLGISFKTYDRYDFWQYSPDEQEAEYKRISERREQNRSQKQLCIKTSMIAEDWDREYAEEHLNEARERVGITYKDYNQYGFWKYSAEEQEDAYRQIRARKKKTKLKSDETEKPLVVVLSRNYATGLSVIRSIGAAGYTVDLVASAYKPGKSIIAASSKYVRSYVEVVSKKVKDGGDNELVRELLRYAGRYDYKPVLFPTDDYTASIMDLNRNLLDAHFIMPSIVGCGEGAMTERMDKTVQGKMAKKAGLLTPKEWIFSLEEELVIPDDMVYPCFCKPIESITGYKKEMAVCNDEAELKNHLNRLRRIFEKRSILVQEFLEIDNEIDLSGVCLDQEIIIPAIIKKTNVAQYETGVTLAGKVVPFDEISEIKENVINMLKDFHYFGMFDMELNLVGDKIYFNEVNLRSGGPNYSYFMSGVNLPALFIKEALGQRHTSEEEKVSEYGKSFIYEKVAWDDYIKGFITKKELNDCIAAADITLLCNNDDPEPGRIFTRNIKKTVMRSRLRNIKRGIKKAVYPVLRTVKQTVLGYPQTKKANRRDTQSDKPRVIVSGRNYCTNLSIARSLGEAGYEVEVLRIFQVRPKRRNLLKMLKPDAYSSYVKAYHVCVSRRRSRRIVNRLKKMADPDRKMLLIPADDLIAYIADDYLEELQEYYLLPNIDNKAGSVIRMMNKGVQKELAEKAGLPVLNSCVIKTIDGEFEIPDSVTYPCFMKPNISKNSSKSRMRKCDSEDELRGYLTEFSQKKDIEMLVEDYVDIKREYSLIGVSTKDGVAGPGLFGAVDGGQNEHRGVAVTGEILPCSQMQPLVDDIISFVDSIHYEGLFDVDLIETADGRIYFVELNMRFGASGYAVTESGVNLPGMFADYMIMGKPIDPDCSIRKTGKTFVSEKVLIEEYTMGRLSMSKLSSCMNEADVHFVWNKDDMKPYRHFRKFYPIAAVMRQLYKIKERRNSDA